MNTILLEQRTIYFLHLQIAGESYLMDCKARGISQNTVTFYRNKLSKFLLFCETRGVKSVLEVDETVLREFLIHLEEGGHNPGGIHAHYRVVRSFLRWVEAEYEPEGWRNPVKRVKAPRVPEQVLEPAKLEVVQKLIEVCGNDFHGRRDEAVFRVLLDTGLRANELLSLNVEDVAPGGVVTVRHTKGKRPRLVFLGKRTRKALRQYLSKRVDGNQALFVTEEGERLTYFGLRSMVKRRSEQAVVRAPALHSFRRAFAIESLRNGADLISIQRLLGHKDLTVLRRYLAQTGDDLQAVHHRTSPAENI